MNGANDRSRMPAEVRPALGPFVEAVPLFFRQETLELVGLLTVLPLTGWVMGMLPRPPGPTLTVFGGFPILVPLLVLDFLNALLVCGAVLLLLPVARGERGLLVRPLLTNFGILALVTSVIFGVETSEKLGAWWMMSTTGWNSRLALTVGHAILDAWLVVWAAWFLARRVGPRDGTEHAGSWLLLWPGLLAAALAGGLFRVPYELGVWKWEVTPGALEGTVIKIGLQLFRNALLLFAALWMIRSVENEVEGWHPEALPPP